MTTEFKEALEQARHAIAYAKELDRDDDDYVEICPIELKMWKTIRRALLIADRLMHGRSDGVYKAVKETFRYQNEFITVDAMRDELLREVDEELKGENNGKI